MDDKELVDCPECDGTGEVHSHNPRCWECGGKGKIPSWKLDFMARRALDYEVNKWAMEAIDIERRRQQAKGWTTRHDDMHGDGSIAKAAAVYAMPNSVRDVSLWPWDKDYCKMDDRITELVKAGALIVAEIERLKRLQPDAGRKE